MKKLAFILPFWPLLLGFFALTFFCKSTGFGIHKISSEFPYNPEWEVSGLNDQELLPIYSQSFKYLGNGAQSFAFVSEDGKYVIKFFKMKYLTQNKLGNILPIKKYQDKNIRHAKRLKDTFAACKMAFEELKEETGLLYVHLNATDHLKKQLYLYKDGKKFTVDLDKTVFLVQEKAEMVYKRIGHFIKAGKIKEARESLNTVVELVQERNRKGFEDIDTGISRNYGFIGNRPIHLDFLGLIKTEAPNEKEKIETKMLSWVEKHYPGSFQN